MKHIGQIHKHIVKFILKPVDGGFVILGPEWSAVVTCTAPVGRVRLAYAWTRPWCGGFVFGFRDLLWVLQGQCFILGAL